MYELDYSQLAFRQLKRFSKVVQKRIVMTLERCKIRPYSHIKRLVGSPFYSLRVGDYRVIMDIKDDKLLILVIEIGHRKRIYKN
ncbi:MAG: type II toxin-antitoxin system RelE/ParE family toxin [Nanoarchaeota archaeon]|nr:type II toxin-antitoxin system RelE/ParE family toxin [Nanoarchaeota archaeon]